MQTDTSGNQYYEIKLYFPQTSEYGGGAYAFDYLCYDLSELIHKKKKMYFKFVDCREIFYYVRPE